MADDDKPASPKVEDVVSVSQHMTMDTISEASQVHESSVSEPRTASSPTVSHAGVATIDHNPEVDHPEAELGFILDTLLAQLSSALDSNAELENGPTSTIPSR